MLLPLGRTFILSFSQSFSPLESQTSVLARKMASLRFSVLPATVPVTRPGPPPQAEVARNEMSSMSGGLMLLTVLRRSGYWQLKFDVVIWQYSAVKRPCAESPCPYVTSNVPDTKP